MNTVEDQLLALLRFEFGLNASQLTLHSRLDDLGDSLALVQALFAVEDTLGIRLGDNPDPELVTVADLLRVVAAPTVA
jgi:acyl carrier protein